MIQNDVDHREYEDRCLPRVQTQPGPVETLREAVAGLAGNSDGDVNHVR